MPTESDGGLSQQEFLLVQQQIIELRNKNYELQEELRRKNAELQQNSATSPRSDALQFASKLINRGKSTEKYEAEMEVLRRKLATQEEEFKLQQTTLFEEMNKVIAQNNELKSHSGAVVDPTTEAAKLDELHEKLKSKVIEIAILKEDLERAEMERKTSSERAAVCEKITMDLEDKVLDYKRRFEQCEKKLNAISAKSTDGDEVLKKTSGELDEFRRENERLADAEKHLSQKCAAHVELEKELELKVRDLENVVDDLRKKLNSSETSLEDFRLEKALLKAKIADEKDRLEEMKLKLADADENARRQREILEKKLEDKCAEMEEREKKSRDFLEENAAREAQVTNEWRVKSKQLETKTEKMVEDRALLLETRYQLEIDDLKKSFETEKEELSLKIVSLQDQIKAKDAEKQLALKKQSAILKELQKALRDERRRADSLEKKSEEKTGWHVVSEHDGHSNHTFDGNESVSSFSAIESENVELISRLAALQRVHSENVDRLLYLEAENSRLKREVDEKGELIENWIRDRPVGFGSSSNTHGPSVLTPTKHEGGFRRLLNATLGGDGTASDLKDMNKKLQRMLEETLSKNILLQRDLQTLLERTEA